MIGVWDFEVSFDIERFEACDYNDTLIHSTCASAARYCYCIKRRNNSKAKTPPTIIGPARNQPGGKETGSPWAFGFVDCGLLNLERKTKARDQLACTCIPTTTTKDTIAYGLIGLHARKR